MTGRAAQAAMDGRELAAEDVAARAERWDGLHTLIERGKDEADHLATGWRGVLDAAGRAVVADLDLADANATLAETVRMPKGAAWRARRDAVKKAEKKVTRAIADDAKARVEYLNCVWTFKHTVETSTATTTDAIKQIEAYGNFPRKRASDNVVEAEEDSGERPAKKARADKA